MVVNEGVPFMLMTLDEGTHANHAKFITERAIAAHKENDLSLYRNKHTGFTKESVQQQLQEKELEKEKLGPSRIQQSAICFEGY